MVLLAGAAAVLSSRADASVSLRREQCLITVNGHKTDLEPQGAVIIGSRAFVSARVLTYLGATYSFDASRRVLSAASGDPARQLPVTMINRWLDGAVIAYPYLPIRAAAQALGWQAKWRSSWEKHPDLGRIKVHSIALEKAMPGPPGPPPTWDELFSQHAEGGTVFDNLTVTMRARVDARRPRERFYVCVVSAELSRRGGGAIHSGNYALFVEDEGGGVVGVEGMAQSECKWPHGTLNPSGIGNWGEQPNALFIFPPEVRLRRLIYSDGIRSFAIPFSATLAAPNPR